jgi:hypothetical protein
VSRPALGYDRAMTPTALLEQLVALHAQHDDAHRRMVAALENQDLLGLVEASRRQGSLCTEQGALLAHYIAAAVSAMPDVDPAYRERIDDLARQLREEHGEPRTQKAG